MKKTVFVFLLLFLGLAVFARADAIEYRKGMFMVTPFAGAGIPVSDMSDDDYSSNQDALGRATALKFGAAVDYWISEKIAAGLQFRYASFPTKNADGDLDNINLRFLKFGAALKYYIVTQGTLLAYTMISGGLMFPSFTNYQLLDEPSGDFNDVSLDVDSKPYVIFGGGLDYFVTRTVAIFAEFTIDYLLLDGAGIEYEGESFGEFEKNYFYLDLVFGLSLFFGGGE